MKKLTGECQHCGGAMLFHAEAIGSMATCPNCGQETPLRLATPREIPSAVTVRGIIFIVLAILILVGGLLGALAALKKARLQAEQQRQLQTAPAR